MLKSLTNDLRFAARMMRRSPVFTLVAAAVIALGVGAVTTIFSALNALALRQLPATTDGARLVGLRRTEDDGRRGISASRNYVAWLRAQSHTLKDVAAWSRMPLTLAAAGEGYTLNGNIVSGNYFDVLGVRPALGRFFLAEEDSVPLAHPVVVISHAFWTARFGGDTAVLHRPAMVNGHPYTIIGVAPRGFSGVFTPLRIDAWVPIAMHEQVRPTRTTTGDTPWLWAFGRMADGANRDDTRRELTALTAAFVKEAGEPQRYAANDRVEVIPLTGLPEDGRAAFFGFMGVLLGAAALVLVIAAVNVAGMLSARAIARRREMALRTALGAARTRLVRQLLTETVLLFLMGGLGGVVAALGATAALEHVYLPGTEGLTLEISPDARVLAFAVFVSLGTGIAFGIVPALQGAERNIGLRLKGDSAASIGRRSRAGSALIVAQLALSMVLLVAAGLFLRTLSYGSRANPGFDRAGVLTADFNSESWGYDSTRARAFDAELLDRVAALPGVASATFAERVPMTLSTSADQFVVPTTAGESDTIQLRFAKVTAGYFDVLRLPILRGRGITAKDRAGAPMVAVVNQRFAERHFPGGNAIGATFTYRDRAVTIVGIARDARYESPIEPDREYAYFSLDQMWQAKQALLVRVDGDPQRVAVAIQDAVRALDPALPRPAVSTLLDETSIALFPQRMAAIVTAVLGGIGLLLATVGLYGIVAYSTSRRSREIGIRMAVGAKRRDVLAMVLRDGMGLAGTGVLVGIVLAAGATQLIAKFLYGVAPLDVVTFAAMSAVFTAVALLASWLPARRAAASDPMSVLRAE